jgi:hypothetical protein
VIAAVAVRRRRRRLGRALGLVSNRELLQLGIRELGAHLFQLSTERHNFVGLVLIDRDVL